MPSFTGKAFANFYKNILGINQSGNTGVDTTTRNVQDGARNNTSISLSDDVLKVQPLNDNTTRTFNVRKSSGADVLSVNTTDSKVLVGTSQVTATTMYAYFTCYRITPVAGTHMVIPYSSAPQFGGGVDYLNEINLGNGTDPATTWDVSASGVDSVEQVLFYWYLPDAITVDAVQVLMGGSSASTASSVNFHLNSYTIDTDNGGTSGDLSSGVVVADGAAVADVHEDAIKYQSMSVDSTNQDIAAGKAVLATIESTGTEDISARIIVKYHIQ